MNAVWHSPLAILLVAGGSAAAAEERYRRTDDGIIVTPERGSERAVRLRVYGDRLFRVTSTPSGNLDLPASLMVTARPVSSGFTLTERAGSVVLATPRASAEVDLDDGDVRFRDANGEVVLGESGPAAFTPLTIEGQDFLSVRQQFNRGTDEGFFGLGQHQNRQMNYNGEDVELAQHNMDVAVPFVVSTRNYGLLWDNNSITRFGDPRPYGFAGNERHGLRVTAGDGTPGWSATYYLGAQVAAHRNEPAIDYQYLDDQDKWPAAVGTGSAQGLRVVWQGRATPASTGIHRFRLYASGYFRVFVDGRPVVNSWRQNWNPWYRNFDVPMTAGRAIDMRVEWEPNGGHIAVLHNDPLPEPDRHSLSFASEAGHGLDYYFIGGDDMDGVIAGYRALTGRAPMLPLWAYGFWQSRQRYETQEQLLDVLREYRRRGLPIDNIVQDWLYWPENAWGCQCFDPARFPDPQGMVDEVHRLGAHVMISVWAKFYPGTANYRELDGVGGIYRRMVEPRSDEPTDADYVHRFYRDWVGQGYSNAFYDPYNRRAREIYWRQIRDGLASRGFDAWWLDSDEPDFHSNLSIEERARRMSPTALGPGAAFFNSYPLLHVEGLYRNLVEDRPDVRPFILTRSGFGGIQRAGAAVWSGDVASRWDNLREQISAGINFSMSGIPNWSHDIGGYTMEPRFASGDPAHVEEWRELNLRWFQFGAFSPIFRSHGETIRREIYEIAPGGSAMYRSMEYYDRLRYRLMPYIYTLAADTWHRDGTIMRGLVMDFASDRRTWNVDDEYMFGPAFLVAPVTEFRARSRRVYLPAGTLWYDFYTGRAHRGGRVIQAAAPYERIPLFVRAGSIVPVGPHIQHTEEGRSAPVTVLVHTGADGRFDLYEDDGVSRQYLNGAFSRIPIRWDEASGRLIIGARQGSFPGMAETRTLRIRWVERAQPRALDFSSADETVTYTGAELTVRHR